MAAGLAELGSDPGGADGLGAAGGKASEQVQALLVPLVAKEAHDGARAAMLIALGRWLAHGGDKGAAVEAIKKGLAEKNAEVRRAHLGGLLELGAALRCGAKGAAACLALLAEPAIAMLRPYLKKAPAGAASRADAVSLLCVLAEASAAGGDKAKAACVADKVWALTLKAKDSFVWQDASSATEREGAALPY